MLLCNWVIFFIHFIPVLPFCNNCKTRSNLGVFCKKGVLKNFTKLTGKHLCQSLFFKEATKL